MSKLEFPKPKGFIFVPSLHEIGKEVQEKVVNIFPRFIISTLKRAHITFHIKEFDFLTPKDVLYQDMEIGLLIGSGEENFRHRSLQLSAQA